MSRPSLSIVNLLSGGETLEPPSRPKTPSEGKRQNRQPGPRAFGLAAAGASHNPHNAAGDPASSIDKNNTSPSSHPEHAVLGETNHADSRTPVPKTRLEREYVRIYLSGLHYIHPMIDPTAFVERCEDMIWTAKPPPEANKRQRHFFALYNIVVAVGALVAGSSITEDYEKDIHEGLKHLEQNRGGSLPLSSQVLSRTYFRKSRALLGDVFEVCSLESAQTLLLMVSYLQ
ncbi:hypothetical protein K4F52_009832 [Lecanicillium sp. MT-2017a]|nr:hypothetical protein K4F52_009832 [Lecanicillium sp. MT-2017a]